MMEKLIMIKEAHLLMETLTMIRMDHTRRTKRGKGRSKKKMLRKI